MLFSFFDDGINSLIETEGEYDEFIQQLNLPSRNTVCKFYAAINEFPNCVWRVSFYVHEFLAAPIIDFYEEIAAGLSDDEGKRLRKNINEYHNENELKLQCCVLMLDTILKQVGSLSFLILRNRTNSS